MADPGIIRRLMDDGWDREAAVEHVQVVTAAIAAQLDAGKTVVLDGIGQMRAPLKVVRAGFPPNSLRQQRKVELRNGAKLQEGDPYPDPRARPKKVSTYASR